MTAVTWGALVRPTADLRLAVPAAGAWVATVALLPYPQLAAAAAFVGWAAAVMALIGGARSRRPVLTLVAVTAAAIALVATAIAVHEPARRPSGLIAASAEGTRVTLTMSVTRTPVDGRFAATVTAVHPPGGGAGSSTSAVPVLVFDAVPDVPLGLGSTVRVTGTLVATEPGDGTAFLLFAGEPATVTSPPPAQLDWANGLRAGFAVQAARLGGDGGMLLPGLAIGDTSRVDESLDLAMKTSSLTHLTAVSGANCAIIVGLIMLAGGAVGIGRTWRIVLSLAVLVAFVVLVTPEPSVLRAGVMAGLVLIATASGRPASGVPVLSLAVLGLLTVDPWLARSFGFALSVLATAGLLLLAAPLTRLLARALPLWLAAVVAVPVAAQLACQPVLVLLDPTLPAFGIVANILAAPAAPVATVVGLAACVLSPLLPAVAAVLTHLAWLPAAWIGAVARFFAGLPLARIDWPGGVPGALLLATITVLALLAVLGPARQQRRWPMLLAAMLLAVVVGVSGGTHIASVAGRPAGWQLAACPVGQGDAMLVRSAGHTALIDTGPEPEPLAQCLSTLGVDRLDLLVLSHFDLDHVGGSQSVLGRADAVLTGPPANAEDERLLDALASAGSTVTRVSRGAAGVLGDLRWEVLWPPARLGDIEPGNDASVVVRFDPAGECVGGCLGSLFLGDLGEQAQERMTRLNRPVAPVDVVKVSHHGSADQSDALYRSLRGSVGLVGVGADNDYGHPADPTIDLLESTHTEVARTDQDGLVLVAPSGRPGDMLVWRENGGVGGDD